jgi:hypothetical protein
VLLAPALLVLQPSTPLPAPQADHLPAGTHEAGEANSLMNRLPAGRGARR